MKIKFFEGESPSKIKLENIYLSAQNPRYTTLKSIENNMIELIRKKDYIDSEKTKKTLLKYEGDFLDLKNLFQSIYDIGFDTSIEPIILIENKENYVVAEGNRRIMCLKIIYESLELNQLEEIGISDSSDTNVLLYDELKSEQNYRIRREQNYKDVVKLIKDIKQKCKEEIFQVHIKIAKDEKELWKMIYTKHITGERPGMRKWNRGKYFTDLLSFFENGIEDNSELFIKIRKLLQREPSLIVEDFKHAQFVKEIFKRAQIYETRELSEITNEMIYREMKEKRVSALQFNFSLKRVKDSAKDFLKISYEDFDNKFFKLSYDERNILIFKNNNKLDDVLQLVYENYRNKVITTRPIKSIHKHQFDLDVKKVLTNTRIDTKKPQTIEKLEKLDSFDYSIKELGEIVKVANYNDLEKKDPDLIGIFKFTRDIKIYNKEIKKINNKIFGSFYDENPSNVFIRLKEQYHHNEISKNFLNAMGSTLRSILEQLIIWGGYFYEDVLKTVISGDQQLEIRKDKYCEEIAKAKIHNVFDKIFTNNFNIIDLKEILKKITNKDKSNEAKFIYDNKNEIKSILNELVHASHRIYDKKIFNNFLQKFSLWQKNIISIMEDIDYKKILKLGQRVKSKI